MRIIFGLLLLLAALVQMSAPGNATPLCAGNNACSPTDNSVDTSASATASATGGTASNSNVNAPVTVNTNTAKGGEGGKGGDADATAVNFNANIAKGGNVSNSGNSSNTNRNKNTNVNLQGQDQSQRQWQGQEQGQSQSVDGSGNSNVNINNPRQPVNSAIAAALTSSNETCMGSSSIGGQGVGFGLSIGSTWENEACERRRNASVLFALGLKAEAVALMCQDDTVAAAFAKTGMSCTPVYTPAVEPAFVPMAPIPN